MADYDDEPISDQEKVCNIFAAFLPHGVCLALLTICFKRHFNCKESLVFGSVLPSINRSVYVDVQPGRGVAYLSANEDLGDQETSVLTFVFLAFIPLTFLS